MYIYIYTTYINLCHLFELCVNKIFPNETKEKYFLNEFKLKDSDYFPA